MALTPGTRLGPYEIVSAIGAGGMGEVYRARDTRLNRTVAIKVLLTQFSADPHLRERFEHEAKAISQFSHPHICALYDVGQQDGIDYLVMEYLEGQTLAQRLLKGAVSLDQGLQFAVQIADALGKAHRHGIVHRDLKPGNIMLTKTGAKLLDFGLAKTSRPTVEASSLSMMPTTPPMTAQGTILGTLQYMAPEQLQGKDADTRSDIFSFGAIVYEMLTGKRAFEGSDGASVIAAILDRQPAPMSTLQPLTPPALDRVVNKCLAKDPDDRWQSARDVRTALEWTGDTTRVVSRRPASPARWVAIGVALLASGGVLGWFGALLRAPVSAPRALSLEIGPPAGGELVLSVLGGGSAISPDGRTVAFVAKVNGFSRVWLRPIDSIMSQELPDTDEAQYPFWSPDGRSLGYFARGYLRRIDVLGGRSTSLTQVSDPRGGSWGADGVIVFGQAVGPLQRINASGVGVPSSLTTLASSEVSHRLPRFLPDGRTLFFFIQGDRYGVYLTTLDRGSEKHRVVDALLDAAYVPPWGTNPGYVLMVQGDSLVAQPFDVGSVRLTGPAVALPGAGNALTSTGSSRSHLSVAVDGTVLYAAGSNQYQLTWFSENGTALGSIGVPDRYVGLRISPDGTQALTFVNDAVGNRDIWRVELPSGARYKVTSDNRGGFGTWSPDSQRIAFSGSTRRILFEKSISGGIADRELMHSDYPMYPTDWSRDGKDLLYSQQGVRGHDVWALPLGETSKATRILGSPAAELHGAFSPDGRFIAFTSDESGRDEVYIQNVVDATIRRKVSTSGGGYPRWGTKGDELFYRSLDSQLMARPVRFNGTSTTLGEPRLVMRLIEPPAQVNYPYDVASDGRILALAPVSGAPAAVSLALLINWQAALRR